MSRFSGLPPTAAANEGGRFAGLRDALKVSKGSSVRLAAHRAEAKAQMAAGEFDWAKAVASQPSSHANRALKRHEAASHRAPTAKAATPTAAPAAKPKAAASPPARKLGRAEAVALAVRTDPKLKGMEDIALHMLDDPDLKGLSGEGVVRCLTGLDPALYRASMAKELAAKADAVWTKARASIDDQRGSPASATAEPTNQPAPARKLTAAEMKADAVWDRARASINGRSLTSPSAQKPATGAKTNPTDDIWARAYAAAR